VGRRTAGEDRHEEHDHESSCTDDGEAPAEEVLVGGSSMQRGAPSSGGVHQCILPESTLALANLELEYFSNGDSR